MAALSVHSTCGGATKRKPYSRAERFQRRRIGRLAATPPATTSAGGSSPETLAEAGQRARNAVAKRVGNRQLERGANVGDIVIRSAARLRCAAWRTAVFSPEKEKSGRGSPFIGRGKAKRAGSPRDCRALDIGTAGIGQAKHLRGLVESLAQRVVDGGRPALVVADAADQHDLRVAAGNQQQQIGKGDAVGQPGGQRMAFEMVDRHQRLPRRRGHRLGRHQPDDQAADKAGTGRRRDGIDLAEIGPGIERGLDDAVQRLDMGARRDFGHDAAKGRMLLDLAEHDIGQNLAARRRHRSATTLAAVSSQLVSIPRTRINWSLCAIIAGRLLPIGDVGQWPVRGWYHGPPPCKQQPFRIGTRGSPLALAQAAETRARLMQAHRLPEEAFAIEVISTSGDRIQDRPLSEVGGKGLFTKEIEEALLSGRIDIAVHSSKDMATGCRTGLSFPPSCRARIRATPLSARPRRPSAELPHGATIGSSSLRRQALIRRMRPDLEVVMFRGNVQTRLRKLEEGDVDGTILAHAGLRRLGLEHVVTDVMPLDIFPPAPGQGAICIESRIGDERPRLCWRRSIIAPTAQALACERAFLAVLDGSCRTPIAGYASVDGEQPGLPRPDPDAGGRRSARNQARRTADDAGRDRPPRRRNAPAKAGRPVLRGLGLNGRPGTGPASW